MRHISLLLVSVLVTTTGIVLVNEEDPGRVGDEGQPRAGTVGIEPESNPGLGNGLAVGGDGARTEAKPIRRTGGVPAPTSGRPDSPTPTTSAEAKADRAPASYIEAKGLSEPSYPKTITESYEVPMFDGIWLYAEVTWPDPSLYGDGPWPVVMEVSPYHGTLADRDGIRVFPDARDAEGRQIGLTGYFAPRGYAVAMVNLRGSGRSQGCFDHLGPNDAKDLKTVVEWAADQSWSTGKVGMTGHSYPGSTPSIAAAQNPRGLVTIAPSAGLASMYDHQFQWGVPYFLQWAGPQYAYTALTIDRHLPPGFPSYSGNTGDNFGRDMQYFGCGAKSSALTSGEGQVTGQYKSWHSERDWRDGAAAWQGPVFMIHGVNDNAARIPAAEWFFGRRFGRPGDKVWLGQWDHGSGAHVNRRYEQWMFALHAWFDKHLQGRAVDTGPPLEVFLNDGSVWTSSQWSRSNASLSLRPDARDASLRFDAPGTDSSVSFTAAIDVTPANRLEFRSQPLGEELLFVGLPTLNLTASQSGSQVLHLITALHREDAFGELHPMTYCAMQPSLRDGIGSFTTVVPAQQMALRPQCFTMAHTVRKGERLVLTIGTRSPHHVPSLGADARVTVFTGPSLSRMELPLRPHASLWRDVPLYRDSQREGPPQPTIRGSVTVPAPWVTWASREFDVEPGHRSLEIIAWPRESSFAGVAVYHFDEEEDEWEYLAETSGYDRLRLELAKPPPGRYEISFQYYAGPPNLEFGFAVTFFNAFGEPGPS